MCWQQVCYCEEDRQCVGNKSVVVKGTGNVLTTNVLL